ncbi:MAG: 2-C-methyl-D-erythritol 2,4-cyclodiphosphate synthase [Phycisphaerales bacterium]|nr:2-C-methyl-D-erythritol 2,4-cyclodiphosphate synthase [Phycisphaerales bacterium]
MKPTRAGKPAKRPGVGRAKASPARSGGGAPALRVGHGYDLHRLEVRAPAGPGRPLIVGGVILDDPLFDRGPVAHSDGDVLYHAVTDALLGALALPDIGQLFPDTLPAHAGQDSADFVRAAYAEISSRGWSIVNLDCTVILQRPKLSPVKDKIRANLARLLGLDIASVNLKGKTHEKVDAVGESRAIEAHVVALLWKR